MISLPKYQPLQWVIIEGKHAFGQIINAEEKEQNGWVYLVSTDGNDLLHIKEADIEAYQENGKWMKKSSVTTQNVYS